MVDRENKGYGAKTAVATPARRNAGLASGSHDRVSSSPTYDSRIFRKSPENFVENYVLPVQYNTTQLTLLIRNPFGIHAYWEVADSNLAAVQRQLGAQYHQASLVIRMYDVTCIDFKGHNANQTFDIDVGFHSKNWYIDLWQDNSSFCADLGLRLPDGNFQSLTRSNVVHIPRVSASERTDMIWMAVNDEQASQPYVMEGLRARAFHKVNNSRQLDKKPINGTRRRKIYLTEEDIRGYYGKLFPLLRRLRAKKGKTLAKGRKGLPFQSEDAREGMLPEDIYIPGQSRSKFLRKLLLGSSAELVEQGGASEKTSHLAKGASEREQAKRKFFFEIWTELIVYGRTEPDAEVLLGKQKIKLRPDGTFTLRYALPDGKIPFPFMAQSADKVDRRYITTSVERAKTIYQP